jgi:hypothetical protein
MFENFMFNNTYVSYDWFTTTIWSKYVRVYWKLDRSTNSYAWRYSGRYTPNLDAAHWEAYKNKELDKEWAKYTPKYCWGDTNYWDQSRTSGYDKNYTKPKDGWINQTSNRDLCYQYTYLSNGRVRSMSDPRDVGWYVRTEFPVAAKGSKYCFDMYSRFDRGVLIAFNGKKVFESYSTDPGYISTRALRYPDFLKRISGGKTYD